MCLFLCDIPPITSQLLFAFCAVRSSSGLLVPRAPNLFLQWLQIYFIVVPVNAFKMSKFKYLRLAIKCLIYIGGEI